MDFLSTQLSEDLYSGDDVYLSQIKPYCDVLLENLQSHMPQKLEHSNRVGFLCFKVALQMGKSRPESQIMGEAARLHDIGYIMHPVSTWVTREKPDTDEKKRRKLLHTKDGHSLLTKGPSPQHPFMALAREGALNHHETLNGLGPYEKKEFSSFIEILGACDAYDGDAIVKPGVTPKTGQEILDRMTTTEKYKNGFHKDVLKALAAVEQLKLPSGGMVVPEHGWWRF